MSRILRSPSNVLLLGLAVYVLVGTLFRWGNMSTHPIIDADGKGYYAYLPALFIHDDLSFGFVEAYEEKYYEPSHYVHFTHKAGEGVVNKYFIGTSVLMSPFFALAHWAAQANGAPADGYSWPYQMSVSLAALFWLFFGAWLWMRFLAARGCSAVVQSLSLVALLFGTGLFYYGLDKPSASHVYSASMVCAALFLTQRVFDNKGVKPLVLLGAVVGLIALIRPTNLLVVMALPFVASDVDTLRRHLPHKANLLDWGLAVLAFGAVCAMQPIMYWVQTGFPWVWSYGEEGFDFAQPEIFNVLWSYRKGLFVYTPMALLGLAGVLWRFRSNAFQAGVVSAFFVLTTWVISSWWCWYYGGSFGMRPYLEYMPILLMGVGWLWEHGRRGLKWVLALVVTVLVYVNVVQSYQFHQNIMPWDGMTKESYHGIFLNTNRALAGYYHNHPEKWMYVGIDSLTHRHDFAEAQGWKNERILPAEGVSSFAEQHVFGPVFRQELDSLWSRNIDVVRVTARLKEEGFRTEATMVVAMKDSLGRQLFWNRLPIVPQMTTRGWNEVSHVFRLGPAQEKATVEAYLYKEDGSSLLIDDMAVTFLNVE